MASRTDSAFSGRSFRNVQDLTERTWKIFKHLSDSPETLRDVQSGLISLFGGLRLLYEYTQQNHATPSEERTLFDHIERCGTVVADLEASLERFKLGQGELTGIAGFGPKLFLHTGRISSFYDTLRRNSQSPIVARLESLRSSDEAIRELMLSNWATLLPKLQKVEISSEEADENYFFIINWLKGPHYCNDQERTAPVIRAEPIIAEGASNSSQATPLQVIQSESGTTNDESSASSTISAAPRIVLPSTEINDDEELPGYSPGQQPTNIAEKSRAVEQSTAILAAETSIGQIGTSSKAAPPAYTFEAGADYEIDEEFSKYIQRAIANELKRRYLFREENPTEGSFPYSWLPKDLQKQFAGRAEVNDTLDPDSFTVMGYETTPAHLGDVETLISVLRMSSDGTGDDNIFREGVATLKTMDRAFSKFIAIQDQTRFHGAFSDLDALLYEATSASIILPGLDFPQDTYEFAQKTYYMFLTYLMGMVLLFKDIFPGRTYVTRSRQDLVDLWKDRKMDVRTAWIEKQLAGWSDVDAAIHALRNWHRERSARTQGIRAVQQWRQAEELLLSSSPADTIHLTVKSATGMPKFRSYQVKISCYGTRSQNLTWQYKTFDASTGLVKSLAPEWNETVAINLPDHPKTIHLEIYDCGNLSEKTVGIIRLNFQNIPGVERNFEGRSLLYGFDDDVEYTFKSIPWIEGKGKGKEIPSPKLQLHLRWRGRFAFLEDAGLPTSAPGKMFKPTASGVPQLFDDVKDFVGDNRSTRSGASGQGKSRHYYDQT